MSLCEWNPMFNEPSTVHPSHGDCPRDAVVSVKRGQQSWHLCESCAALPAFAKYRKRTPLARSRSQGKE